jgi:hypothetical protein
MEVAECAQNERSIIVRRCAGKVVRSGRVPRCGQNVLLDMLPVFCVARKEELYFGNQALFEPLESDRVHISWASLGKDAPQSLVNIQLAGTRIYERLRHTNTFVARKILSVHLLE